MAAPDWPAALARMEAETCGDDTRFCALYAASIALYRAAEEPRSGMMSCSFLMEAATELRNAGEPALAAQVQAQAEGWTQCGEVDRLRDAVDGLVEEERTR